MTRWQVTYDIAVGSHLNMLSLQWNTHYLASVDFPSHHCWIWSDLLCSSCILLLSVTSGDHTCSHQTQILRVLFIFNTLHILLCFRYITYILHTCIALFMYMYIYPRYCSYWKYSIITLSVFLDAKDMSHCFLELNNEATLPCSHLTSHPFAYVLLQANGSTYKLQHCEFAGGICKD